MAASSALAVAATSPMIQRLMAWVAAGGAMSGEPEMPFDWQKRAAFHSLVAKLR